MPKKFFGENSKAKEARTKKESNDELKKLQLKQQEEEECWKESSKAATKKQLKKAEAERKKQEQIVKKAEKKALLEQEAASLGTSKKVSKPKVTRADIEKNLAQSINITPTVLEKKARKAYNITVEDNINRIMDNHVARNVTEAINILDMRENWHDKHPEKRLRAAYNAFEEKKMVELKLENPKLRHSQLKVMIFKEWQNSPENPQNCVRKYFSAKI